MATKIKVLLLNCHCLNNPIKAKHISSIVLKLCPNILMLQETHLSSSMHTVFKSSWWSLQLQSTGSSKARGVAVF